MTHSVIHLSEEEINTLRAILRAQLTNEKVFVFGSRAKGTHRATSDIDLAIQGNNPISIATRSALEFAFSESSLPYRVDIVDLLTADESFRRIIESQRVPLNY